MTTVEILDTIQKWLTETVCKNMNLKVPDDNNVEKFELANPNAYSAYMPIKKSLPQGIKSAIPGIVVTFEEGTNDNEGFVLPIRLIHCVYSPGLHKPDTFLPNNDGWRDLLNFMDKTRAAILRSQNIDGISVVLPLKTGFYNPEEQIPELDPYYFGWIMFDVKTPSYPKAGLQEYL